MSEILIKLGLAALFGLVIGVDREVRKKPLGLKTCLVLSVSSCLLTIVSIHAAYDFLKSDRIMMDPMRLAAQIVSGVGFIGAGVILKRTDDVISGLTTAAMIWGASGLGVAVGAGYFFEAGLALVIILIGVDLLPYLLHRFGPSILTSKEILISFVLRDMALYDDIRNHLISLDLKLKGSKFTELDDRTVRVEMRALADEDRTVADLFRNIREHEAILKLDVRSLER